MSVDDKYPQWIRVSTHDMTSPAGRFVLGARTAKDWANYGRWFALQQLLATMPDSFIDVSSPQRLKSLAHDLTMTPKACAEWLSVLSEGGAIDTEAYETRRIVCVPDIFNAVSSYQSRVRVNRANGARGGRRKASDEDGQPDPTDTGGETDTKPIRLAYG